MKSSPATQKDSPAAFLKMFRQGMAHIVDAAKMLKRLVGKNPGVLAEINELDPSIPMSVFSKLLLAADGKMRPELLFNAAPAFRKLQEYPIEVQSKVLDRQTVTVVRDAKTGFKEEVQLEKVKPYQIPQVFDKKGVVPPARQRIYLAKPPAERARAAKADETISLEPRAWFVSRGVCVVSRPCTISRTDLVAICAELGVNKATLEDLRKQFAI